MYREGRVHNRMWMSRYIWSSSRGMSISILGLSRVWLTSIWGVYLTIEWKIIYMMGEAGNRRCVNLSIWWLAMCLELRGRVHDPKSRLREAWCSRARSEGLESKCGGRCRLGSWPQRRISTWPWPWRIRSPSKTVDQRRRGSSLR